MSVEAGWYVDPADPETRRYWDGEGWLGAPIPVDATPPDGPPPAEPPPVPVTPAVPAATTAAPGWAPHPGSGPPPGYRPQPGHGPQPGQGGPGWTPQAGPPGWPPQGAPPGWAPQGVPPGWPGRPSEPRPHGLRLAGYGRRFVARLIDFTVVFALNALVNGWFVWRLIEDMLPYWREVFRRAFAGDTSTENLPQIGEQAGLLQVVILLIATALWAAYEVPGLAARGQTFGKRVMRIRAVPLAADQPLGFARAFGRWTTMGLPTLLWYCAGLGLVLQLVDALSPLFDHPLRQALHDKRVQTVVVEVPVSTDPTPTNDRDQPSGDTP
ncbi:RDD family protein [Micromonospora sp. WMMD710]|uniref:RDD family protein n=1 Tax=Micromonospora sp. WMMD710 TaxID=3016085 RepID=UPI002416CABD|nr:RDD family protein [Micromonospora sp. WMMD710]MDG4761633.1 RDD family protein [Micromonospora sp. WMMD710]